MKIAPHFILFFLALLIALTSQSCSKPGRILNFPATWTNDWQSFMFSKRLEQQPSDILIVLITDLTLSNYWVKSPINRRLLAVVVRDLERAGAKAIGMDVIVDGPSRKSDDQILIDTLSNANIPIAIGRSNINQAQKALHFTTRFFDESEAIPVSLSVQKPGFSLSLGDDVVRRYTYRPPGSNQLPSLVASISGKSHYDEQTNGAVIDWVMVRNKSIRETFHILELPKHKLESLAKGSLIPESLNSFIDNKIVLIGGDFETRDQHHIPMSITNGEKVPGVFIHAQMLSQALDNRRINSLNPSIEFAVALATAILALVLSSHFRFVLPNLMLGAIVFVAAAYVFHNYRILLPSTILITWAIGVSSGNILIWLISFNKSHF